VERRRSEPATDAHQTCSSDRATHNLRFPVTYLTFPAVAYAGGDKFVIVEESGQA
jgi:hypothetical protein